MKNRIYFILFFIGVLNCNSNDKNNSITQYKKDEVIKYITGFYNWYLNEVYQKFKGTYFLPGYTKLGETNYVFDIGPTMQKFRNTNYFSEYFIKNDSLKIVACNNEMLKFKWEYKPDPEFNISSCNFLWKDRIIGGQGENLDSFKILETISKNDSIVVVSVDIFEKERKQYNAKVEVLRTGINMYKVNAIELEWIRYK